MNTGYSIVVAHKGSFFFRAFVGMVSTGEVYEIAHTIRARFPANEGYTCAMEWCEVVTKTIPMRPVG